MIITAFETIKYNGIEIANILKSPTTYLNRIKANYTFTTFEVPSNMRADYLAFKLYGNSNLQWLFAALNPQIKDGGFNDWLMNENTLHEYTENKYQFMGGSFDIHHHVDENEQIWYNMTNANQGPFYWYNKDDDAEENLYTGVMRPISNIDYERDLNEAKFKRILIIRPEVVGEFIDDLLEQIRR